MPIVNFYLFIDRDKCILFRVPVLRTNISVNIVRVDGR